VRAAPPPSTTPIYTGGSARRYHPHRYTKGFASLKGQRRGAGRVDPCSAVRKTPPGSGSIVAYQARWPGNNRPADLDETNVGGRAQPAPRNHSPCRAPGAQPLPVPCAGQATTRRGGRALPVP